MKYKAKDNDVYVQRLSEKNGELILVWHKVCMSNGFKLLDVVNLRKKYLGQPK